MTDQEIEDALYLMKDIWADQHRFDALTMQRLGLLTAAVDSLKESVASMSEDVTRLRTRLHAVEAHLWQLEAEGTFKDKEE